MQDSFSFLNGAVRLCDLPDSHMANQYAFGVRKLPIESATKLYFVESLVYWISSLRKKGMDAKLMKYGHLAPWRDGLPETWFNEISLDWKDGKGYGLDAPFILIPAYSRGGELAFVICRHLTPGVERRYFHVSSSSIDLPAIGLDAIDPLKPLYIVEGSFDQLYLPNSLCAMGVYSSRIVLDLPSIRDIPRNQITIVFDNDYEIFGILLTTLYLLDQGYNVLIWPEGMQEKDLNDLAQLGHSSDEIKTFVDTNTFTKDTTGSTKWVLRRKIPRALVVSAKRKLKRYMREYVFSPLWTLVHKTSYDGMEK